MGSMLSNLKTQFFVPPSKDQAVMVVNEQFLREEADVQLDDTIALKINGKDISLQVVGVVEEAFAQPTLYLNYEYFARTFGLVGRSDALSYQDMAERLGTTVSAIKSKLFRARKIMAQTVSQQHPALAPSRMLPAMGY